MDRICCLECSQFPGKGVGELEYYNGVECCFMGQRTAYDNVDVYCKGRPRTKVKILFQFYIDI